ncbi:MAG: response regulator [Pseudomonadota bacterium]
MSEPEHIVIVDDETDVRETLREYLSLKGYKTTALADGAALRALVEADEPFDLALLDITMPGEDGLSLARHLREATAAGVIMVTASGETVDRIIGLEMGADDYLPKPVDLRELLARVKAVLRRRSEAGKAKPSDKEARKLLYFGQCKLDPEAQKLYDEDGKEVFLSSLEFSLLKAFADNPNRVLSRDQLLELAHDRTTEPFDRSIDVRIARIRRKIEHDPGKPQVIKTVRGAGYIYEPGGN